MSKYVPGPWRVYIPGKSWSKRMDRCRVITETGNAVCEVQAGVKPQNAKERKTAQLIAAAPELLEAAKSALHEHQLAAFAERQREGCACGGCSVLRQAIAKAEGKIDQE